MIKINLQFFGGSGAALRGGATFGQFTAKTFDERGDIARGLITGNSEAISEYERLQSRYANATPGGQVFSVADNERLRQLAAISNNSDNQRFTQLDGTWSLPAGTQMSRIANKLSITKDDLLGKTVTIIGGPFAGTKAKVTNYVKSSKRVFVNVVGDRYAHPYVWQISVP